jgi:hypothetical protein
VVPTGAHRIWTPLGGQVVVGGHVPGFLQVLVQEHPDIYPGGQVRFGRWDRSANYFVLKKSEG